MSGGGIGRRTHPLNTAGAVNNTGMWLSCYHARCKSLPTQLIRLSKVAQMSGFLLSKKKLGWANLWVMVRNQLKKPCVVQSASNFKIMMAHFAAQCFTAQKSKMLQKSIARIVFVDTLSLK